MSNWGFKKVKSCKEDINRKVLWHSKKDYAYVPEQSLLSIASNYGNEDIVNYLISKGARIDDEDDYGSTPLHYASRSGHLNIVKILINNGANINKKAEKIAARLNNIRNGTGETPLHNASRLERLDVVKYLISMGAKLDIPDYFGNYPINNSEQGEFIEKKED